MKTKHEKRREKRLYTTSFGPMQEYVTCPSCGHEIAIWTEGDNVTQCGYCGHKFFRRATTVH